MHMVPESAVFGPQVHHYHLVFSEQMVKVVLTVVAAWDVVLAISSSPCDTRWFLLLCK